MTLTFEKGRRGSTIAEVLVGMVVLTLVVLAVLGLLIQSSYLQQTDEEQTEILAIAQGLLEARVDDARVRPGFHDLASIPLTPAENPRFLYRQDVVDLPLGIKKVSISVYHADPEEPGLPDSSRVRDGHALTLSVSLTEPTP